MRVRLEGTIECRDLVVFVPGLMGSALERDGAPLWDPGPRMGLRALLSRGGSLAGLLLAGDSPTADDVGDGVVATRLVDAIHMIPGLWKIDAYGPVLKNLRERLTLAPGENYYEFPYDWRRDVRHAARRLGREVNARLRAWRERSGNADAQVVLIAHSLGGLVARYYLECLGGWLDARSLITLGTPHRGAMSALKSLVNGMTKGVGPLKIDLSKFVATCTTGYQLLPIWACYDGGDGVLVRPGEATAIPGVDPARAAAGLAFHRELQAAVASNRRDPHWEAQGYDEHPVVGTRQRTAIAARLVDGRLVTDDSIRGRQIDGDSTVSRVSATPVGLSGAGREVFVAAKHAVLHNAPEVVHHIEGVITGASIDLAEFFAGGAVDLSLELDDLYAAGAPIAVEVGASDDPGPLEVVVTPAAGGAPVLRRALDEAALGERVELPGLAEGTYRLRVAGDDGVRAIEDVFAVVGAR
ncbi:MAG: hypothetical protein R3A79_06065 [Nannocystaceae bacterium]